MHYTLKALYNRLKEQGNVLTGRIQVVIGDIRNQYKCSVTIIVDEASETNKIVEKKYTFSGYLVPDENKIENDSSIFTVVPVYRNRLIFGYFEFGFNKRTLFGSNISRTGNYIFERKEIKEIEIRLVEPGPTGYVDPKVLDAKPDFIIIESIEFLRRKLVKYFNDENSISIYLSNNPSDMTISITLRDDFKLPEEKLKEFIKEDNLSNNLQGYKILQIVVRSDKTNKILYVSDL